MPTLSIPKDYSAGNVLQKSHLDSIESAVETFLNTTQIGYDNIDVETTLQALTQSQAETILTTGGYGTLYTTTLGSNTTVTSVSANINTTGSIPAGKYLITANAITLSRTTADTSVSATLNNVYVDLYNLQTGAQIVPGSIVKVVKAGITAFPSSNDLVETVEVVHFTYFIDISTTSTFAFKAYRDVSGSDFTGFILQDSTIQLYRVSN